MDERRPSRAVGDDTARAGWSALEVFTAPAGPAHALQRYRAQARSWAGFTLRDTVISGAAGFSVPGPYVDSVRLSFLLESVGGAAECRERADQRGSSRVVTRPLVFSPVGLQPWMFSDKGGTFRTATLRIDPAAFEHGPLAEVPRSRLAEPRMMFTNDRMWRLGRELADECRQPDQFSPLYCDSLVSLLVVDLLRDSGARTRQGGLTRTQLARAIEYIEHNPAERVRLSDLAALVGMSLSHFSHAFRQSTGMPPYRWQLNARIRNAQQLLLAGQPSLASVALATGFADQAHFTRTFRRIVGATPTAWIREHRS